MKRVSIGSNLNPNFIGAWIINKPHLFDEIVSHFELNQNQQKKGATGPGIFSADKDSIDMTIKPKNIQLPENNIFKIYFENLFECYKDYINQWPFLEEVAQNLEIGAFNIQRYKSGQHYKRIHTERCSIGNLHRLFAFMTYLNDVEEGGSTYFSHYDIDIQPQKGLTLLWPAEWTHAHRGNILKSGSKYILTGWFNFSK